MCGSVHDILLSAKILCGLSNSLLGKLVYSETCIKGTPSGNAVVSA